MKWNSEDVKKIEKFIEIRNKGYYASGAEVTEVYNRVLEKNVSVTNCGSCIRQRITELENALKQFRKLSEEKREETLSNVQTEENKPRKGKKKE